MAKKRETPTNPIATNGKVINWRISTRSGGTLDLNVMDNDVFDHKIRKWMEHLSKGGEEFFCESYEQGEVWVSPKDFSMATRTAAKLLQTAVQNFEEANEPETYQKIADISQAKKR